MYRRMSQTMLLYEESKTYCHTKIPYFSLIDVWYNIDENTCEVVIPLNVLLG
jgi:hypothetical protein